MGDQDERRRVRFVIEIDNCRTHEPDLQRWLSEIVQDMDTDLEAGEIIGSYRVEEVWDGAGRNAF